MAKRPPLVTREQVDAVENLIATLHTQNEEFYHDNPKAPRLVPDDALNALRYTLLKYLLETRRYTPEA